MTLALSVLYIPDYSSYWAFGIALYGYDLKPFYVWFEINSQLRRLNTAKLAIAMICQMPVDGIDVFWVGVASLEPVVRGLIRDETKHLAMGDVRIHEILNMRTSIGNGLSGTEINLFRAAVSD